MRRIYIVVHNEVFPEQALKAAAQMGEKFWQEVRWLFLEETKHLASLPNYLSLPSDITSDQGIPLPAKIYSGERRGSIIERIKP